MAKFMVLNPGGFIASNVFTQLDSGVGLNRANRREDTLVVQFFLEALRPKWGGSELVKQDGSVGKITTDAILAFQKFVNTRFNGQLATDSAVDPALSQARLVLSTLGWMHQLYVANFPTQYPDTRRHPAWTTGNIGLYLT